MALRAPAMYAGLAAQFPDFDVPPDFDEDNDRFEDLLTSPSVCCKWAGSRVTRSTRFSRRCTRVAGRGGQDYEFSMQAIQERTHPACHHARGKVLE